MLRRETVRYRFVGDRVPRMFRRRFNLRAIGERPYRRRMRASQSDSRRRPEFGWLILGVWGGVVIGDCIAVMLVIQPGYVESVTSAPTLLVFWLSGAFGGILAGWFADARTRQSPNDFLWITWFVMSLGYWILLRIPFTGVAR